MKALTLKRIEKMSSSRVTTVRPPLPEEALHEGLKLPKNERPALTHSWFNAREMWGTLTAPVGTRFKHKGDGSEWTLKAKGDLFYLERDDRRWFRLPPRQLHKDFEKL